MARKKMGMDTERKRKGGKVEPKHETRRTTVGGAEFDHFNLVFFGKKKIDIPSLQAVTDALCDQVIPTFAHHILP